MTRRAGGTHEMTELSPQTEVPEVLFVCVHNAGRSQMAAGLLAKLAEEINPVAVEAVREIREEILRRVDALLTELIER